MKHTRIQLGAATVLCILHGGSGYGAIIEPFAPKIEQATLRIGEEAIRARASWSGGGSLHVVGDVSISIDANHLIARRAGKTVWEADAEGDCQPVWLASDRGRVFLAAKLGLGGAPSPTKDHVRVIDVVTGKWLAALSLTQSGKPATGAAVAVEAFADNGSIVVAAQTADGMLVECFGQIETGIASTPTWEVTIPRTERTEKAGDPAVLLAAAYPDRASEMTTALTLLGRHIIVCSGVREPIVGLEASTGKLEWALTRPWEYQRGFIGPSVWSHTLGPFGKEQIGAEPDDVKAREEFESRWYGTILAGPAASAQGQNFFVVTGKGPIDCWTNYLMEATVLEVSEYGQSVAISPIPRRPLGVSYSRRPDGVIWACQGNGLSCFRQSEPYRGMGGPGGPDRVCDLQWMRRYEGEETKGGWLYSPGIDGVVAFDGDRAFMGTGGMRVLKENDQVVLMTIIAIDLRDGSSKPMTLEVPFVGNATRPTTNYQSDSRGMRSSGPYLMGITRLHAGGGVLLVTVGEESKSTVLEFALPKN